MNNPLSRSFSEHRKNNSGDIEVGMGANSGVNLNKFFEDVAKINGNLKEIKELHSKLRVSHEETKTAHNAGVVKALRSKMNQDAKQTLKRVKLIQDRLEVLEKSNEASRGWQNVPLAAH
ncbi:hypothetical protein RDABS01_015583 [Bienertia sinuspersici]